MGKTLLNKFGNAIKRSVLAGLIGLSFAACEPVINPTPNYTPTAGISSTKTSIKLGESVPLTFQWGDQNGNGDITNYRLGLDTNADDNIDKELLNSPSAFDNYSWTPNSTGTFKLIAQDTDKAGEMGKADLEIVVSDNIVTPTNYAPTITSNPISQINEKSSYNYQVIANDPEGNNLTYSVIEPPWLSVSSAGLVTGIVPSTSADTNCNVEIDVSDGTNVTKQNYTLTQKNLLDIIGNIQDVETLATQAGEVRIYDGTTRLADINSTDGNFSFHASSPVAQVKLQARFNGGSYIRTLTLDGTKDQDLTNGIRIVPYPNFCSSADFIEFMREINISQLTDVGKEIGLSKWDLNQLKGIEILSVNPKGSANGYFDLIQQNAIESRIKNPDDIGAYVSKARNLSTLNVEVDSINPHYTKEGNIITGIESGWIIVIPDNSMPNAGETPRGYLYDGSGVIKKALIKIDSTISSYNNPVLTHEFGHAFIAPNGEATLSSYQTIMNPSNYITTPGVADKKAGKIIYENTYLPREKLDDILGMNWMN